MKITIEHNAIKALLICAAKIDVRYYLKGVHVDARADGRDAPPRGLLDPRAPAGAPGGHRFVIHTRHRLGARAPG